MQWARAMRGKMLIKQAQDKLVCGFTSDWLINASVSAVIGWLAVELNTGQNQTGKKK